MERAAGTEEYSNHQTAKLSGKYFIDSITHHVGTGYTMDLEMSLVESMTEEVIKDAIVRLYAVGVISATDYWVAHYKDINGLDSLILSMASGKRICIIRFSGICRYSDPGNHANSPDSGFDRNMVFKHRCQDPVGYICDPAAS